MQYSPCDGSGRARVSVVTRNDAGGYAARFPRWAVERDRSILGPVFSLQRFQPVYAQLGIHRYLRQVVNPILKQAVSAARLKDGVARDSVDDLVN